MIHVQIDLIPSSDPRQRRNLGLVLIANDGTGTQNRGNYKATLYKRASPGRRQAIYKQVYLKNFPRKRMGAYHLLFMLLAEAVANRCIKEARR